MQAAVSTNASFDLVRSRKVQKFIEGEWVDMSVHHGYLTAAIVHAESAYSGHLRLLCGDVVDWEREPAEPSSETDLE